MNGSEAKYSFAVTLANGCGGYYPSEKNMKKYPRPGGEFQGFGYYEVYGYPQTHSYKFQDNIAGFVRDTLLEVEKQAK